MADSFPFTIWSGLLQNGHKEKIGSAIWEFLWCINKVTKEIRQSENALPVGIVLGGKPIKADEIAKDLKIHPETVKSNLRRLKKEKYIDYKLAPYGYIITVSNSKKYRYNKKALPQQEKALPNIDKAVDKAVDIIPKASSKARLTDADFIAALKANKKAFGHIDIDHELAKMDAWLLLPKARGRKKTKQFVLNWLNKIEKPLEPQQAKHKYGGSINQWDKTQGKMPEIPQPKKEDKDAK